MNVVPKNLPKQSIYHLESRNPMEDTRPMNKKLQGALLSIVLLTGCAAEAKFRSVGQHDPTVEIAKENAVTIRVMAEAMKAQAEALAKEREAANAPPTPTPTPEVK